MNISILIQEASLDQRINDNFKSATSWFVDAVMWEIPITETVGIPWVLIVLILGASYFTVYFRALNFTKFWIAIQVVQGKYDEIEKPESIEKQEITSVIIDDDSEQGEVSHFQALTAALSATVGLGNIAGVAIALSIGGPGATFWMILVGILGMSSKFVECTLGVTYREVSNTGVVYGGPMYYLSKGLKSLGLDKLVYRRIFRRW